MKRSTAIGHLVEVAAVASEQLRHRDTTIGWPLEELWVAGDLLGDAETLEAGFVVLVLDVPPAELPWLALHPAGEWVGELLRLGKRPMRWCYRPLAYPVWNHELRRLVRFWSADAGLDEAVIESLRSRDLDQLTIVEPSADLLAEQISEELIVARRHLRGLLEQFWDHGWRREHNRFDESPEDHLWRAATAVSEMLDALDEPRS